ncbi:hypothetical protein DRN72_00965 [Methanosarcinales archaeon]|nr:MAG: hypothetical protein DRN72_00965 [Methanosarcinales archaeon]
MSKEMRILALLLPVAMTSGTLIAIFAYTYLGKTAALISLSAGAISFIIGFIIYEYRRRKELMEKYSY